MELTSRWTSTLILTMTMLGYFHPTLKSEKKVNKTWHEHDQTKMESPFLPVFSVGKAARRSYPFRSVLSSNTSNTILLCMLLYKGKKSIFFLVVIAVFIHSNPQGDKEVVVL